MNTAFGAVAFGILIVATVVLCLYSVVIAFRVTRSLGVAIIGLYVVLGLIAVDQVVYA